MDNNIDLPLELIREILLRLPVKSLLQFRCVCKSWLSLISDPNFAESHFDLAAAPTRRCIFIQSPKALSYDLDALFHDGHASVKVSLPSSTSRVYVLASCRGFIMLHKYPQLIIWNPSTGAHKRISYSHMLSDVKSFHVDLLGNALLCGFGYDASMDDYLVVLAWKDKNKEDHFDFFYLRTNSWKHFAVDLPNRLMNNVWRCGLFLNGAFHWLACYCSRGDPILIFDLKERSFSEIPLPERVVMSGPCSLKELGGCLALCFWSNDKYRLEIWVMQEYKVQSSWTLYEIFGKDFQPICLSNDGDIIGFDVHTKGFSKYNISGELLERFSWQQFLYPRYAWCTMYTESLLSLPNDSEDKKKGYQECFEQLAAVTNDNHNEAKERKRIRSAPTWTCDFYCN